MTDRNQRTTGATEPGAEVLPEGTTTEDAVGVRRGMFGVAGTGDTSGYGGMVAPIVFPGAAQRPYGGWFDEVADALEARLGVAIDERHRRGHRGVDAGDLGVQRVRHRAIGGMTLAA